MKKILLLTVFALLIFNCTKLGEQNFHPSDWNEEGAENSHMAKIAVTGTASCKDCHGGTEKNDYYGGTSGVSCYECHAGGPSGHPEFSIWVGSPENTDFHGKKNKNSCKSCHGSSLTGGIAGVSCYTCHETF